MTRREILEELRSRAGEFVSGEELSGRLGLSRAAVWKGVDALRRDGYTVEARPGLGYRLSASPDALTEAEVRAALGPTAVVGRELHCYATVDSTNTRAKELALAGAPDGTAVVADCQSAGRGRLGRSFLSPAGKGVYLSVVLRPALSGEALLPFTALCAVAVRRAIHRVAGAQVDIKWTNDLVYGGRKLCGILTELALEGESGAVQYLVPGIGVNVGHGPEDFPPELRETATSLRLALGREVSRPALAAAELAELDALYAALLAGRTAPYLEEYRACCVTLGREAQLLRPDGSREHVLALDVDEQFGLVVRRDSGETAVIRTGEASVRGMYGYAE